MPKIIRIKFCARCGKQINENDFNEKWAMIIDKKGQKITRFTCFHLQCWKDFLELNLEMLREGMR